MDFLAKLSNVLSDRIDTATINAYAEKALKSSLATLDKMREIGDSIMASVKDTISLDKVTVVVDYNADTQTIAHEVNGDTFKVTVKSANDKTYIHVKEITIPKSIVAKNVKESYDSENHTMTFTITDEAEKVNESPKIDKEKLIKKAKAFRNAGWSYRKIARELGVSDKTIARWTQG